ncbi:MAG: hypothetical protein ACP5UT_01455 [Bryobacteraceae bacterium]
MSDGREHMAGSAARSHEKSGGNVPASKMPLPAGGDAARKAETEGDLINEAHGIRTAPRGEYRSSMQLHLPRVVGARLAGPAAPPADLSERKASDYLPPDLKARLIAEGRLTPEGDPAPAAAAGSAVRTQTTGAAPAAAPAAQPAAPPAGQAEPLARRLLGKLLGFFASK